MADLWFRTTAPDKHVGRSLPIAYERKGAPGAWLLVAFGVVFAGFPLVAIPLASGRIPWSFVLPFLLFGGACAWLGAAIQGSTEWKAPLEDFRGVLAEESAQTQREASGDMRETRTLYRVLLKHRADATKDTELFSTNVCSSPQLEQEAEAFSKLLGVPLLREKESGGFEERAPGDLDESLAQRAREGEVGVAADPGGPPPAGAIALSSEAEGDVLRMPLGGKAFAWFGAGLLTAGVVVIVKASIVLGLGCLRMGALFSFVGWADEILHVGSQGVRQEYELLGARVPAKALTKDAIKDVILFREKGSRSASVRLIGAGEQLVTGQGVPDAERRWLKDYLTSRLAR